MSPWRLKFHLSLFEVLAIFWRAPPAWISPEIHDLLLIQIASNPCCLQSDLLFIYHSIKLWEYIWTVSAWTGDSFLTSVISVFSLWVKVAFWPSWGWSNWQPLNLFSSRIAYNFTRWYNRERNEIIIIRTEQIYLLRYLFLMPASQWTKNIYIRFQKDILISGCRKKKQGTWCSSVASHRSCALSEVEFMLLRWLLQIMRNVRPPYVDLLNTLYLRRLCSWLWVEQWLLIWWKRDYSEKTIIILSAWCIVGVLIDIRDQDTAAIDTQRSHCFLILIDWPVFSPYNLSWHFDSWQTDDSISGAYAAKAYVMVSLLPLLSLALSRAHFSRVLSFFCRVLLPSSLFVDYDYVRLRGCVSLFFLG